MRADCYCDYEPASFYRTRICTAKKQHRCCECGGIIFPGEKYEYVAAQWPNLHNDVCTYKTCERCVDLRTWAQNNLPCFCPIHHGLDDSLRDAVDDAYDRAFDEAKAAGLRFGLLRRFELRRKFNEARR